jgi:methyl-accepting chemotaxis protein
MSSRRVPILLLTESERDPKWIGSGGTLVDAVEAFQADTDLRLLPLLDRDGRPAGAIFEKDIRRLLLNPFGHALLRNPSINRNLEEHRRSCPTMELTENIGALIDHYRRSDGREGMILTVGGRLYATLTNRRLLLLAAEHEHHANEKRLRRAEQIAASGLRFEMQAGALAEQMVHLANGVQRLAEATADRAGIAGNQATSVASAAVQTRDSLTQLADRGRGLASAFGRIEQTVASNRETAGSIAVRVKDGGERARNLLKAARSIDSVMTIIGDIAGTVNLLSLNATIEAARAGDSGRGFAVVAGEIRKLSDQTQEATQSIESQVRALRSGIELVASDYAEMLDGIASLATGAAEIDEAIAREADTTRLIARSVADAGQASVTIEQAVSTIAQSVRSASASARELDRMANDLRSGASALGEGVSAFLEEVRAA